MPYLGGTQVHRLAAIADLEQLKPILVTVAGQQVAVVRIEDEVFAFAALCTHRAAPMTSGAVTWKRTVLCPWHLGTFSLRTGEAKAGPPDQPLPLYPVTVVDGVAYLDAEPARRAKLSRSGREGDPDAQRDLGSDGGCHAVPGTGGPDLRPDGKTG
jgi:nitrite reductase/ring-hydroxylating ferredoxin subunit